MPFIVELGWHGTAEGNANCEFGGTCRLHCYFFLAFKDNDLIKRIKVEGKDDPFRDNISHMSFHGVCGLGWTLPVECMLRCNV